jgi:putative CocE/NonD family hydrolase
VNVHVNRLRSLVFCAALLLAALAAAPARWFAAQSSSDQDEAVVRAHFTKYEYRIPMRDGVNLFTAVYVPKDTAESYPFLMVRTPYSVSPYGVDQYPKRLGPAPVFQRDGFIFVNQDVRGRYMSEGTFEEVTPHKDVKKSPKDVDESTDTYDTIEWLLHHVAGNNGKVGIWGISYPGFFAAAGIIDSHPALKAASPQAPVTDLYMGDDAYHNGAFMLAANFGFYASYFKPRTEITPPGRETPFDYGTTDSYDFFLRMGPLANAKRIYFKDKNHYWDDQVAHSTYDQYWKSRNISAHMRNVHCAVLTVGGWFDAEDLVGPGKIFHSIAQFNPETSNKLVLGPWVHGGWARGEGDHLGDVNFAAKNSDFYNEKILLPFFREHLKDAGDAKLPTAYAFETGSNVWRRYDAWPPTHTKPLTLYFRADGRLVSEAPGQPATEFDEYVSDPNHPVPFVNFPTTDVPQTYMDADQRFAAKRPDVLVYQTDPLEDDVTVSGPVSPRLWVSSSGTDSDFIVKLIDIYPMDFRNPDPNPREVEMGGYQQLVRGEPFRGKFRNSFEKPEPFTPNQPAALNFSLPDINHSFRRGHRIMVQIQSTWFPLIDRNPQKFMNIPDATASDFVKATERVYRSKENPTSIVLPVIH